jgi:hypothetical protein
VKSAIISTYERAASRLAAAVLLLVLTANVSAHRLDEYLQATMFSVEKNRVQVTMRLIPGVAVFPAVLAGIDTNGDGVISQTEQHTYAQRVLGDLSLTVDGKSASLILVSEKFPPIAEMKEGQGEIQLELSAVLSGGGPQRRLVFENHHLSAISVYLVNSLVPRDPDIRILAQNRDERQTFYQLDYAQAGSQSQPAKGWTGTVGFSSIFHLGMRHIAEGPDHLLFLLALLLPAPLLALGSRWTSHAGTRHTLAQILRVVTAFTVGHSITLALAAWGLVRVPARPIEVLIAVSILISAIHALRPLFPGREAGIAAFFGLIHGLAFAATLGQVGLGKWQRVLSILGFNLGIETMQLIVVAATMPSLVLLSRTRAYSVARIGGALFAGFAAAGWIAERLFNVRNPLDALVAGTVHYAVWIAAALFLISLVCWSLPDMFTKQPPDKNVADIRC